MSSTTTVSPAWDYTQKPVKLCVSPIGQTTLVYLEQARCNVERFLEERAQGDKPLEFFRQGIDDIKQGPERNHQESQAQFSFRNQHIFHSLAKPGLPTGGYTQDDLKAIKHVALHLIEICRSHDVSLQISGFPRFGPGSSNIGRIEVDTHHPFYNSLGLDVFGVQVYPALAERNTP